MGFVCTQAYKKQLLRHKARDVPQDVAGIQSHINDYHAPYIYKVTITNLTQCRCI